MDNNYLQQSRKKPFWSYIFFVLGVLLLIFILSATFFGLIFLQSVDENLDLRRQALVASRRIDFNTYPFDQSFFKTQDASHIDLQINTYNHTIDALELHFYIETDEGLWREQDLRIIATDQEQLKLVQAEIQEIDCDKEQDCYLATLLLISADPQTPFTSRNLSNSIAKLEFIPQKEGAISLQLNQNSQVNEHGTGQNILQSENLSKFTYYVSNNGIDFAQCRYLYSEWSNCENFWQTRQYQVVPLNCHWHQEEVLQPLSQQCSETISNNVSLAKDQDFFLHYFRNCLNSNNQGEDFYLMWNSELYSDFDWLDVSLDHRFSSFYQKSTKNAQLTDNYKLINLADFTGFTQDVQGQTLNFQADQKYYFRLYKDQTEEFVMGPLLYLNFCSSDISQNRDCQESCNLSDGQNNCLEGLNCIDGYCRLASNPENQWCFDPSLISNTQGRGSVAGISTQISDSRIIIQGPFLPSEVYDLNTYACNHGCNTNRDCMANYRCYQGRCRLASNPESPTCEEAAVVVQPIEVIEKKDISLEEDEKLSEEATLSATPEPTIESNTISAEIEEVETDKLETEPTAIADEDKEEIAEKKPTAIFANLSAALANLFNSFNWQYLALAGLLIIIAIVFIILGLTQDPQKSSKKKKDMSNKKNQNKIEQKIKQKIEQEQLAIPENKKLDL